MAGWGNAMMISWCKRQLIIFTGDKIVYTLLQFLSILGQILTSSTYEVREFHWQLKDVKDMHQFQTHLTEFSFACEVYNDKYTIL